MLSSTSDVVALTPGGFLQPECWWGLVGAGPRLCNKTKACVNGLFTSLDPSNFMLFLVSCIWVPLLYWLGEK